MKKFKLACAAALALIAGSSAAMSIGQFKKGLKYPTNSIERVIFMNYLEGVSAGVSNANYFAGRRGTQIFCAPGSLVLNDEKVFALVKKELVARNLMNTTNQDTVNVSVPLLARLQDDFPCK